MDISKTIHDALLSAITLPGRLLLKSHSVYRATKGEEFGDAAYRNHADPLLAGELEAAAHAKYSQARFPELYVHIPEDLDRPLVQDGELMDGTLPADTLAPSVVSTAAVRKASALAMTPASIIATLTLLPIPLTALWMYQAFKASSFRVPVPADVAFLDGSMVADHAGTAYGAAFGKFGLAILSVAVVAAVSLYVARRVGIYTWFKLTSATVVNAVHEAMKPIAALTKDSVVRRNWRLHQATDDREAWLMQLRDAGIVGKDGWDNSPIITVGTATGAAAYSGALNAPVRGQKIGYSVIDTNANTIIFGGTGSGKTTRIIARIVRQLASLAARDGNISFYITDDKAVLWRDLAPIFDQAGLQYRLIGCEDGMTQISMFDGFSPDEAVDTLISAAIQVYGGTREFWTNSAGRRARVVLTIAQAWRLTDDGIGWSEERNEDPYSIAALTVMATSPETMKRAIGAILKDMSGEQRIVKAGLHNVILEDAISSDIEEWAEMADEQKSGVLGTLTHLLSDFMSNAKIRTAFASGRVTSSTISISQLWDGKSTMICLPPNSLGSAARIVNVFLKTRLMKEARARQERSVTSPEALKDWKDNPRYMYFVADEYQGLVTEGGTNSDTDFWNVNRSARFSGILATQSVTALESKISENSVQNLVNEMRSKIFASSECPKTHQLIKMLGGQALRSMTFEREADESMLSRAMRHVKLGDAEMLKLLPIDPDSMKLKKGIFGSVLIGKTLRVTRDRKYKADMRFAVGKGQNAEKEYADALRAATWRAEDKHDQWMSQGNQITDVINPNDMIDLGNSYAFVAISRLGRLRRDVISIR